MKKRSTIIALTTALFLFPNAADASQYTVKRGDYLSKIARSHGMSLSDLLELNPQFENPNVIHIGDRVNLRGQNVGEDVVEYARSLQDVTTYVYGGQEIDTIPLKTDCSGWTSHIYKKFGVNLPRTSAQQSKVGQPIAFDKMQAGDLMFFSTRADKRITHVGIYMGGDYWISNLSTKQDVEILSTFGSWTQNYFLWAQRVL